MKVLIDVPDRFLKRAARMMAALSPLYSAKLRPMIKAAPDKIMASKQPVCVDAGILEKADDNDARCSYEAIMMSISTLAVGQFAGFLED